MPYIELQAIVHERYPVMGVQREKNAPTAFQRGV